jgi:hypothetical protein
MINDPFALATGSPEQDLLAADRITECCEKYVYRYMGIARHSATRAAIQSQALRNAKRMEGVTTREGFTITKVEPRIEGDVAIINVSGYAPPHKIDNSAWE